jgi:hypothetical protein
MNLVCNYCFKASINDWDEDFSEQSNTNEYYYPKLSLPKQGSFNLVKTYTQ